MMPLFLSAYAPKQNTFAINSSPLSPIRFGRFVACTGLGCSLIGTSGIGYFHFLYLGRVTYDWDVCDSTLFWGLWMCAFDAMFGALHVALCSCWTWVQVFEDQFLG